MTSRTWPEDWAERRAGLDCPTCAQGRPDQTRGGVRFFTNKVADAYLRKSAPLPGYSLVIWRGRPAADLAELTDEELADYWRAVATASRALYAVFNPAQINYLTYGNSVPHLHTYLLLRYLDDPCPGMPLQPFVERPVDAELLREQQSRLVRTITHAGA